MPPGMREKTEKDQRGERITGRRSRCAGPSEMQRGRTLRPRCLREQFFFGSASASVSAEPAAKAAAAAEQKDDPQAVVAAASAAGKAVAASAAAAEQEDDPQAGGHSVSVFASASTVRSS